MQLLKSVCVACPTFLLPIEIWDFISKTSNPSYQEKYFNIETHGDIDTDRMFISLERKLCQLSYWLSVHNSSHPESKRDVGMLLSHQYLSFSSIPSVQYWCQSCLLTCVKICVEMLSGVPGPYSDSQPTRDHLNINWFPLSIRQTRPHDTNYDQGLLFCSKQSTKYLFEKFLQFPLFV